MVDVISAAVTAVVVQVIFSVDADKYVIGLKKQAAFKGSLFFYGLNNAVIAAINGDLCAGGLGKGVSGHGRD